MEEEETAALETEKPEVPDGSSLIATTPPISHFCLVEEDVSQSSSPGTHISSTSGISLGEAIRQSASKGMESWYQLPAEEDASSFMPPFNETGAFANQTEFPTIEEGTLHSEPDETKGLTLGNMHSLRFETQDSRLSPCLPLLISTSTQGHKIFDDTLYQQTELDFAPLSASLDISEFPGHTSKSLLISDAETLTAKEVSEDVVGENTTLTKNPLPFSTEGDHDFTNLHVLSQHPLPSTQEDVDFVQWSHTISNNTKSEPLQAASYNKQPASPLENLDMVFSQEDGSFLDSSIPAPVLLELLEKEVGILGSSEVSSTNSSSENVSNKIAGIRYTPQDLHLGEQMYYNSQPQGLDDSEKISEQYLVEGETFQDSSEIDFNIETLKDDESLHPNKNRFHHSGITLRLSKGPSSVPGKDDLHKQLCDEIQKRYKERMLLKSTAGPGEKGATHDISSLTKASTDLNKNDTVVEVQSSVTPDELTVFSRCSIERGHKDSEISPTVNPTVEDSSFIGRLAYPISQSTPGTFTGITVRNKLTDRLMQIKAKLTGSNMYLTEEPLSNTSTAPVFTKPQSLQSSQDYAESNDSQTSLSPDRRRIQSLPSLNYIEKVGSWNTNQSFDALVLRGLTGISPKKKAYHAVADSLNRMLSKQSDSTLPKSRPFTLSRGTGSMNNLTATETEHSGNPQLIRSQSCTTVPTRSTESADTDTQGAVVISVKQGSGRVAESNDVQKVGSYNLVPLDSSLVYKSLEQPVDNKETTEKPSSGQERTSQTQQLKGDVGSSTMAMDRFSDVSPDNEFLSSSCSSGHTNQMHSLTSLEVDNFVPLWQPSVKTPEELKEINIEERIPTYLRNLGIDQSPSTILTPFAPKGPIREHEFSPSELRTIKGSTATPNRSMRFSEGGSQSEADISQSSVYSTASTTSVSIPMGSDAGLDSPLPAEMFSQFSSRSTGDRPVSKYDMTKRFGEDNENLQSGLKEVAVGILASEFQAVDIGAAPPLSMEHQGGMENAESLNMVKQLLDHFKCKTISPDQHFSNTSDIEATDFLGMASVSVTPLQKPASAASIGSVAGIPMQNPALDDSFSSVAGIPMQNPASADSFSSVSGIPMQKPASADSFSSVSGIPMQKPASADSFSSVSGIPMQNPASADSFSSVSGIPLQKPASADSFSSVSGILLQKPPMADSFSWVAGIPMQKPASADSFSSVSGIPMQKPASADSFSSVSGIPMQKPASADSFSSVSGIPMQNPASADLFSSVAGIPMQKPASADSFGSVSGIPMQKPVSADSFNSVSGIPLQKPASEDNFSLVSGISTQKLASADSFNSVSGIPLQKPTSADYFNSVSGIPLQKPASADSFSSVSGIPMQKPASADSFSSVSGIPMQNPASADLFSSVAGIPMQKPVSADSFNSVSGIPLQKPASEDNFSLVSGISTQKLASADSFNSVSGIPLQKPTSADYFNSVSGIPLQKPASADSFSSVAGIPMLKPAFPDSFGLPSVSGIPLQILASADPFGSASVSGNPLQKPASAVSFNLGSISGIPLQNSALDSVNDSFVGAKTLNEIRKLLAEADTVGLNESGNSYAASQVKGISGSSSPMWLKSGDSIASAALESRFTNLKDDRLPELSWDASRNSSLKFDKDSQVNVGWDDSLASTDQFKYSIDLENKIEGLNQSIPQLKQESLYERSEPEGEVMTVNKVQFYSPFRDGTRNNKASTSSGATECNSGLPRNVTSVIGGLEKALAMAALSYGRVTEEVTESDDSTADSLAGRVKSLLKKDAPLMHTTQTSSDGGETRTRASVQLKLANRSSITETILNEEDRRRIEQIKRELMEGAKESQLEQNASHVNADRMACDLWLKSEPFYLCPTPSPDLSQSNPRTQPEVIENTLEQLAPFTATGTFYKGNGETSVKEKSGLLGEFIVPLQLTDLHCTEATQGKLSQQEAPVSPKSSLEFSKPVKSITFSSHKRSSPLSLSSSSERGSPAEISSAVQARTYDGADPNKLTPTATAEWISDNCTAVLDAQHTPVSQLEHRHWQQSPSPDSSECGHHAQSSFALSTENESSPEHPGNIISLAPEITTHSLPDFIQVVPLSVSLNQSFHSGHADRQRPDFTEENDERVHFSAEPLTPSSSSPTASSPARKAISCVHVQISPKQEDCKKLDFGPKLSSGSAWVNDVANGKLQSEEPDLSASRATNLQGKEGALIKQDCVDEELISSSPQFHTKPSGSGIQLLASTLTTPERAATVQFSRIPSHDATTQITTESPAITTFSAEIFIDSREKDIISTSDVTARTTPYCAHLSPATDQPLLVPYRPHGSPEFYYVPYTDGLSRFSPVSTIESSHTGSNDAVSPKFPVEVLGSGTDRLPDSAMVWHKEGIYSKGPSPKLAWEGSTAPHKATALETSPRRSAVRHALEKESEHQMGSYGKAPYTALTQRDLHHELSSRLDRERERPFLFSSQTEENVFFPLKPEIDFSREQQCDDATSLRRNNPAESSVLRKTKSLFAPFSKSFQSPEVTGRRSESGQVSAYTLDGNSISDNGEHSLTSARYISDGHKQLHKSQSNLNQSDVSQQSLDDLWARYTNRKKLQQSVTMNNHELSLMERLHRLARLFHNSSSQLSAKDEPLPDPEQSKNHVKERIWEDSGRKAERWNVKKHSGMNLSVRKGYSLNEMEVMDPADKTSVGLDFYPLLRNNKSDSTPSETEMATQTGSEVATQTSESSSVATLTVSSSISTIDTARLINAFGPERVCPSSRLFHLYNAIDLQKRRSEENKGMHSRTDTGEVYRSSHKTPDSASSVSTSEKSWQPRPALKSKKSSKYLNKGVQAGNLEIVNSATKKNTRDVGTVFPSPRGYAHKPHTQGHIQREERSWCSNAFTQQSGRNRQGTAQGLSWFVPAENLKSDSRKENRSDIKKAPSASWYEPMTNTKPWREPLREKNMEEQFLKRVHGQLNRSHLDPPENKVLKPFSKVTLQESLKSHRPDFIFRSRERVKRLHLLAEERRLQTVFQSEREKLFNQPVKTSKWETEQQLQDYRLNQKNRMIPKKEMVQHSKRIYEQLPEVKKRREEEKRRQEYQSYRLKAQHFQKTCVIHTTKQHR
ncbi:uncharacterized protein alms1.S isoform X2 [Xenopus laevis]|uniref:Uncharacterized protein alms1.S isoform X2 n=1 Tax=Xenopus laevis TaxID=8355 RepID=A0A8J1M0J2_XENLA|nr:uncharacterized protein alms1.S isoform X2 [Xenopus laevis]